MEKQTIIRGAAIVVAGITASILGAQYLLEGRQASESAHLAVPSDARNVMSAGFMPAGTTAPRIAADDRLEIDETSFLSLSDPAVLPDATPALDDFAVQSALPEASATSSAGPLQATDCTPQLTAQDTFDALIEFTVTAPCHPHERLVISHADLAYSAYTSDTGTYSAYLPALAETARIDVFLGETEFLQATVTVPEADAHYRLVLQWTGEARFGLHAYHRGAAFGEEGHLHALRPFDPEIEEAFLISLGEQRGQEPMLAEIYSVPAELAQTSRLELELQFQAAQCAQELSAYVLHTGAGIRSEVKEVGFATPACPSEPGISIMALPVMVPHHAQMQRETAPIILNLND